MEEVLEVYGWWRKYDQVIGVAEGKGLRTGARPAGQHRDPLEAPGHGVKVSAGAKWSKSWIPPGWTVPQ